MKLPLYKTDDPKAASRRSIVGSHDGKRSVAKVTGPSCE